MDSGTLVRTRLHRLLFALVFPCLVSCDEKKEPPPVRTDLLLSDQPRAVEAAARVRPQLEKDLGEAGLRLGDPIFIRAFKEEKQVEVHVRNENSGKYELFRTYKVAAASGELGPKLAEGDGQVPEGFYHVPLGSMNPLSQFHLSFNIGFPNAYDQFHQRTGSLIMIHGNQVSLGCLAMTDPKIEEIFTMADAALRNGQPFFRVHIFPFRMTDERMAQSIGSPHEAFWKNLREGYDLFEKNHIPPNVEVKEGRYTFE